MGRIVVGTAAIAAVLVGLWLGATSPPDALQGDFVRIMYVHVPSAWIAFLAFGVTAVASAGWLATHRTRWDHIAVASAEVGVTFTGLSLFGGMMWGKPVWGTYWAWGDPRMTATATMFLVYIGYLLLRRAVPGSTVRANRAAVFGLVAVIQVPLVYFSVRLWRTLHQGMTIEPGGIHMDGSMLRALLWNLVVFMGIYVGLTALRIRVAATRAELEVVSP